MPRSLPSRVRSLEEAVADQQVVERGTIHTFPGGSSHTVAAFTSPTRPPRHRPPPRLGQDDQAILRELGKSDDEIALLHMSGVI